MAKCPELVIPIKTKIIPSKFQLGGTTITVEYVDKCSESSSDTDGQALYTKSKIELKKSDECSQDYKEFVFYHELVHHIFYAMSEDDLRKNESIVNRFATLLQQFINTME